MLTVCVVLGRIDYVRKSSSSKPQQEGRGSPLAGHVVKPSQPISKEALFGSLDWQGGGSQGEEAPKDQEEVNLLGDDWDVDEDTGVSEEASSIEGTAPNSSLDASLFGTSTQQSQPPWGDELLVGFADDSQRIRQSQQSTQAAQQTPTILLDFGEIFTAAPSSTSGIKHSASDSNLATSKPPAHGHGDWLSGVANWPEIGNEYSSSAPGSRETTASPVPERRESFQHKQGLAHSQPDLLGDLSFSSSPLVSQSGDLLGSSSTGFDPFGPAVANDTQWMSDMSLLGGAPQQNPTLGQLRMSPPSSLPFGESIPPHQQSNPRFPAYSHHGRHQSFPDVLSFPKAAAVPQIPHVQSYSGLFTAPAVAAVSAQPPRVKPVMVPSKTSSSAPTSSAGSPTNSAPFDPFADFGNLKPVYEQKVEQPKTTASPQKAAGLPAMTPRTQYTTSGFQQSAQKKNHSAQQQKPMYTSVIGHREERGVRRPFGMSSADYVFQGRVG